MKNANKKYIYKINLDKAYKFLIKTLSKYLLIIYIFLTLFSISKEQNEINLVIKGQGNQNVLAEYYDINSLSPFEIFVGGNLIASNEKVCNFENELNHVTIRSNNPVSSCENMFTDLTNIIEIDLSNFDTSLVESMSGMFNGCVNLKKITFGNFRTYSLRTMHRLFFNCK